MPFIIWEVLLAMYEMNEWRHLAINFKNSWTVCDDDDDDDDDAADAGDDDDDHAAAAAADDDDDYDDNDATADAGDVILVNFEWHV